MRSSAPFTLPPRLNEKTSPSYIASDQEHFKKMEEALSYQRASLQERLKRNLLVQTRSGQSAFERDAEIHRLKARLNLISRFGLDLCLGKMVDESGAATYIGRLSLRDEASNLLLVDWRTPAAKPFFAATHKTPMGLVSRRRYHWEYGKITDYWDEAFTEEGLKENLVLDDQSAFIASLSSSRSEKMKDVLGTIQADQDAMIREGSDGALIVDGGPGTGKTVVALHRTAYLMYSDPKVEQHRGGILLVGPHGPYLHYVSDVLPRLGEEGVVISTLEELAGARATLQESPQAASLKEDLRMLEALANAVHFYQDTPSTSAKLETPWGSVTVDARTWKRAVKGLPPDTPHNEAHEEILSEACEYVLRHFGLVEKDQFDAYGNLQKLDKARETIKRSKRLNASLNSFWPKLDPSQILADLWSVPAYLKLCAPWLTPEERKLLQRPPGGGWTPADLPLLDTLNHLLGSKLQPAAAQEEPDFAQTYDDVIEHLMASDDSELGIMGMLHGQDLKATLTTPQTSGLSRAERLRMPFAHIVVDEAQELTDMQWQMLLRRNPLKSFTIVGDRAQASNGFPQSWEERLERIGIRKVTHRTLNINYRTPREVMEAAELVIREILPDANVPTSVRETLNSVRVAPLGELETILSGWLAEHPAGTATVIGNYEGALNERVQVLTPALAKGLEFDLVLLIPQNLESPRDHVERYVAMTRATSELVILE